MCIWKVFLHENMDKRDGVTSSSKEQMRSSIRVQVQGEITSKGGKDQGAMTDHPQGLRRKVWTSCEKTPILITGIMTSKWHKWRGLSQKCQDEPCGERWVWTGPEKAQADVLVGLSQSFFVPVRLPFDLGAPRSINSSCLRRPPDPSILLILIHHKAAAARWEIESWMSSS
jgi:hypothetical protein